METFTLTAETITLEDGNYNLMLMPNVDIHRYIHTFKYVDSSSLTPTIISDFIIEQTPLLFAEFKAMDNVPTEIKDNYTL